ncbi:MAG: hypothetical protein PWP31_2004 [Clostridia bacterium]|nr:hypothetical protein [Clostridia bacterium]
MACTIKTLSHILWKPVISTIFGYINGQLIEQFYQNKNKLS